MLGVLRPVIVGDGATQLSGIAAEPSGQRQAHGAGGLGFQLGQLHVSSFALDADLHGLVALAAADGIGFPVADLPAGEHLCRALLDRDALRDMGLFMFPGVAAVFRSAMASEQERDQGGSLPVDPLINRLMANAQSRMLSTESSGNLLRRPTQGKVSCHIAANELALEPFAPMGLTVALIGALLGLVRQVIARMNGSGISFQLSAKAARAPV